MQKYGTTKSHEISKIAGECWAMEPVHVKNYFRDISFKLHEDARMEKLKINRNRRPSTTSDCSDATAVSMDSSRRMSRTLEGIADLTLESTPQMEYPTLQRPQSFDSYNSSSSGHQRSYSMSSVSSTNSIYAQIPDFPLYQPHLYPISNDVMEASFGIERDFTSSQTKDIKDDPFLPSLKLEPVNLDAFKINSENPVKLEDFL